jgi:hypothetical protein
VTSTGPRPARTAARAVAEALSLVGSGTYKLGALDNDAKHGVFDCFSFAVRHCYGLPGHRPGFNRGWQGDGAHPDGASVVDDINSNSAIEDAFHAAELFELVKDAPREGDLLAYPTIRIKNHVGAWIGHVQIAVGVSRVKNWNPARPVFGTIDVVECHGPDGTIRAIRKSTGSVVDVHNAKWPKPQHRGYLLRVKP